MAELIINSIYQPPVKLNPEMACPKCVWGGKEKHADWCDALVCMGCGCDREKVKYGDDICYPRCQICKCWAVQSRQSYLQEMREKALATDI